MKMRVNGSRNYVQHQAEGSALAAQHVTELRSIALAPARGIEPKQPLHALDSLRCPALATAIMESRRARKARSPKAVSR